MKIPSSEMSIDAGLAQAALERIDAAVIALDEMGYVRAVNAAFVRMTGYARATMQSWKLETILAERPDMPAWAELWGRCEADGAWLGELWVRHENGGEIHARADFSAQTLADGKPGFLAILVDLTQTKAMENSLSFLAHRDFLTHLPHAQVFSTRMTQALLELDTAGQTHEQALLAVQLDDFDVVARGLGQFAGDDLLRAVAERLQALSLGVDDVCRLRGDLFLLRAAVPPGGRNGLRDFAERVLQGVSHPLILMGETVAVSASIGVALAPEHASDYDTLLTRAQTALSYAREAEGQQVCYFEPGMDAGKLDRASLLERLRHALERKELCLFYQPQRTPDGRVIGAEALMRWNCPGIGMVPPGVFIPLAEESGLILKLGEWALRTACAEVAEWRKQGHPDIRVAVNLSSFQCASRNLGESITQSILGAGIPATALELELTESAMFQDDELVRFVLHTLTRIGVKLAIDDFGTGYSNLGYLRRFNVQVLKLDQSFVRNIVEDANGRAIVGAIVQMAHALGVMVLAEGVETTEEAEVLRGLGCDVFQGYCYARPLPQAAMREYLARHLPAQG